MTQKVRTDLAGHSAQGPRNYNEDRHLVIQLDLAGARHSLLAVADGLGGEGGGDLAAQVCTDELARSHVKLAKAFSNYCKYSRRKRPMSRRRLWRTLWKNFKKKLRRSFEK
jgi:serine/threonine protein phosphatase PrpC